MEVVHFSETYSNYHQATGRHIQ